MKTAIARLLSSAKFWTTIIGMLITAGGTLLARYGLEVSDAAVQQTAVTISGLFGLLLIGQGFQDHGSAAARIKADAPPSNDNAAQVNVGQVVNEAPAAPPVSSAGTFTMLALVVLGIGASHACNATKDTLGHAAGAYVDCMAPDLATQASEAVPAFRDVLRNNIGSDGKIDWAPIRAVAAPLKSAAMRCAFSTVIAEVLRPRAPKPGAPQSSPLVADAADTKAGYDAIRAEMFGGATFNVEGGPL